MGLVWPWDILRMYVVLLTELRRRRNSTGWVDGFPLGRGGLVKLGVLRLGVDDLRGCGGESCPVYSRSTQVRLRRDLLIWAAGVINPSVGSSRTTVSKIMFCLTVSLSFN